MHLHDAVRVQLHPRADARDQEQLGRENAAGRNDDFLARAQGAPLTLVDEFDADGSLAFEEDAQIRELIRRNRLLEQENEVLRRAAAYLSQIHITPPK